MFKGLSSQCENPSPLDFFGVIIFELKSKIQSLTREVFVFLQVWASFSGSDALCCRPLLAVTSVTSQAMAHNRKLIKVNLLLNLASISESNQLLFL